MINLGEVMEDGTIIDGETGEIIDVKESESLIANYDPLEAALVDIEHKYGAKDLNGKLFIPDANTPEGYEILKAGVKEMTKIRTTLDKVRKIIKEPALKRCKDIDGEANRIKARIEAIEVPFKGAKKVKDDEAKNREAARIAKIEELISNMREKPVAYLQSSPELIALAINSLKEDKCEKSMYAEFSMEALEVRNKSIQSLERIMEDRQKAEDLAAEAEEAARVRTLEERVAKMEGARVVTRKDTIKEVEARLEWLKEHNVTEAQYAEFTDRAEIARRDSIEALTAEVVEMAEEARKLAKAEEVEVQRVATAPAIENSTVAKEFSVNIELSVIAHNEKEVSALIDNALGSAAEIKNIIVKESA